MEKTNDLLLRNTFSSNIVIDNPMYSDFDISTIYNLVYADEKNKMYSGTWIADTMTFIYVYEEETNEIVSRLEMHIKKVI
jgi:hypothetical protein